MKSKQLQLFDISQVEVNALARAFFNPNKSLLKRFRMEIFYKVDNPINKDINEFELWNIKRHRDGKNPVKIGHRYFYDKN